MCEVVEREGAAHMGMEGSVQRPHQKNGDSGLLGFTAVNGDKNSHSTFRPNGDSEHGAQRPKNHGMASAQTGSKAHTLQGWRPGDRNDSVMNAELASRRSPDGAKRKRSDDGAQEVSGRKQSATAGRESPKRRLTEMTLDTRASRAVRSSPESSDEGRHYTARRVRIDGSRPGVVDSITISMNPSGR